MNIPLLLLLILIEACATLSEPDIQIHRFDDLTVFADRNNDRIARFTPSSEKIVRISTEINPRQFVYAKKYARLFYLASKEFEETGTSEEVTLLYDGIYALADDSKKPFKIIEQRNFNTLRLSTGQEYALAIFDFSTGDQPAFTGAQTFDSLFIVNCRNTDVQYDLHLGSPPSKIVFFHQSPEKAIVYLTGTSEIVLIDLSKGTILGRKSLAPADGTEVNLDEFVLTPDDKYLLAKSEYSSDIYQLDLDPASNFRINILSLSIRPNKIVAIPDSDNFIILANDKSAANLVIFADETGQDYETPIIEEIILKAQATDLLFLDDGRILAYNRAQGNVLQSITLASRYVKIEKRFPSNLDRILYDRDKNVLAIELGFIFSETFYGNVSNLLTIYDLDKRTSSDIVLEMPVKARVISDNGTFWLSQEDGLIILQVNLATGNFTKIPLEHEIDALYVERAISKIMAIQLKAHRVSLIEPTGQVVFDEDFFPEETFFERIW